MLASIANGLSLLRLVVALPCSWAITGHRWELAVGCYLFAIVSDVVDGALARRLGQASALGGLIDHSSDAFFVTLTLAAFAVNDSIPPLLPGLIPLAFLQYAIDSRATAGFPLRASFLGRWNGIAYFVLAGLLIGSEILGLCGVLALPLEGAAWLLVASTVISMIDRVLARHRKPGVTNPAQDG